MATLATVSVVSPSARPRRLLRGLPQAGWVSILIAALTVYAIAVHGFHPYAEDGGLYLAGVKHLLDPALFSADLPFVTAHLHYSVFAWMMAALVRILPLSVDGVVLLVYVISIALTLSAMWLLASACFASIRERAAATMVFAAWLTMPVAGTSLLTVDPYLTARSFSTAAVLFLLAGALRLSSRRFASGRHLKSIGLLVLGVAIGFAFHPLMAACGLFVAAPLVLLSLVSDSDLRTSKWWRSAVALLPLTLTILASACMTLTSAPATSAYRQVVLTHPCWFLSEWRWYEIIGLLAPVAVLLLFWRYSSSDPERVLARAGVIAIAGAVVISGIFARPHANNFVVARLQPMRVLQIDYCLVFLLLGGLLGRAVLKDRWRRYAGAATLLGLPLFLAARLTFPASSHVELAWAMHRAETISNPWIQAFLWSRDNTPPDARFALRPDYIASPREDAQSFRAIAERNALPDAAKDGGEASITPVLADAWSSAQAAQTEFDSVSAADLSRRLKPFGVSWVILNRQSTARLDCPYLNSAVRVCRLP